MIVNYPYKLYYLFCTISTCACPLYIGESLSESDNTNSVNYIYRSLIQGDNTSKYITISNYRSLITEQYSCLMPGKSQIGLLFQYKMPLIDDELMQYPSKYINKLRCISEHDLLDFVKIIDKQNCIAIRVIFNTQPFIVTKGLFCTTKTKYYFLKIIRWLDTE
jgi:hypothetical protein